MNYFIKKSCLALCISSSFAITGCSLPANPSLAWTIRDDFVASNLNFELAKKTAPYLIGRGEHQLPIWFSSTQSLSGFYTIHAEIGYQKANPNGGYYGPDIDPLTINDVSSIFNEISNIALSKKVTCEISVTYASDGRYVEFGSIEVKDGKLIENHVNERK